MSGKRRILLIESGRFIGGVIQHLFSSRDQLNVIEAAPSSSRELLAAVDQHRPEIVVLDDTLHGNYLSHLLRYMRKSPHQLRVVVVNTNSNSVDVYQKEQIDVRQTADFFAIL